MYEDSSVRIIINGRMGERVNMQRGIKQGCPLAALLYLIYVEPLHLMLQKETQGMRVWSNVIFSTGFIDDVSIFIASDIDFYSIKNILSLFEATTNSQLNKNKTSMLTIGSWKYRTFWPLSWLNPTATIKLIGINFNQKINQTIKLKSDIALKTIKNLLLNTQNQMLTIHQRAVFFNCYALPVIEFFNKILPIPPSVTKKKFSRQATLSYGKAKLRI